MNQIDEQTPVAEETEPSPEKAIAETIRICKEQGVLSEYLQSNEQNVTRILMNTFSRQNAMIAFGIEKKSEGFADGVETANKETACRLRDMGFDESIIAQVVNVSLSKLQDWFSDSPASMPRT